MAAILTLIQQNSFKVISENWANTKKLVGGVSNFEQLEKEVEQKELKQLLGVALLQDLQANPGTAANIELLDGASFVDCNNNTINQLGLRFVLAYLNHSKYIPVSGIESTFTGLVQKNRNETQNISDGKESKLQLDSREIALQEFQLIKQFLNENSDDYPLWICGKTKQIYTPIIRAVKKTLL